MMEKLKCHDFINGPLFFSGVPYIPKLVVTETTLYETEIEASMTRTHITKIEGPVMAVNSSNDETQVTIVFSLKPMASTTADYNSNIEMPVKVVLNSKLDALITDVNILEIMVPMIVTNSLETESPALAEQS